MKYGALEGDALLAFHYHRTAKVPYVFKDIWRADPESG